MNAQQLRPQSRLARSHQLHERVLALEFLAGSPFLLQLTRILGEQRHEGNHDCSERKPNDYKTLTRFVCLIANHDVSRPISSLNLLKTKSDPPNHTKRHEKNSSF